MRAEMLKDRAEWMNFVASATGATIFHELRFLDYHPAERFRFAHLVVRDGDRIAAALPGALDDDGLFQSSSGASVGGFAVGWAGIEITLPPPYYALTLAEIPGYALFRQGFELQHCRYFSRMDTARKSPKPRQASYVRALKREAPNPSRPAPKRCRRFRR